MIGWAILKALEARPAHEGELRRGRRQASRRAAQARQPRSRGRHREVRTASRSSSFRTSRTRTSSTSPGSSSAYEEIIRKVRSNKLTPDDFAGTTVTLTNPGTVGTRLSVPRLMPKQGLIVGTGAIGYPPEYEASDPRTLASLGVSKVITITTTYDHRVIQGAESGQFLAYVHELLLGADRFYDEIFASMRVPYEPVRWSQRPGSDRGRRTQSSRSSRA